MRPEVCSIRRPRPPALPTHSPTTAPIGATAVATRSPDISAGSAAGMRMCRRTLRRDAPMVRARSSQPGSVRLRPSKKALVTGKKMIRVAMAIFEPMP